MELLNKIDDIIFVFPVHPNQKLEIRFLVSLISKKVILTDPLSYPDFVLLIKYSWLILTDSGGLQEEAPSLGVPVWILRQETERKEAIDAGTVELIGTNQEKIVSKVEHLYSDLPHIINLANAINPYGDGKSTK